MSIRRGVAGVVAIGALLLSPAFTTLAQGPSPSGSLTGASPAASPVDLSDYAGLPKKATLRDGSPFRLAKATSKRIAQRKPLTVYLSAPTSDDPRFREALDAGTRFSVDKASQAFLPIKGRSGFSADATSQAVDIAAQADSGKVDCIVVWPTRAGSLADSVDHALAAGVPIVSIGYPAGGDEFTAPGGPNDSEGAAMAEQLIGWMVGGVGGHLLQSFAFATTDPSDPAVQRRMLDFEAQVALAIAGSSLQAPGPTFVAPAESPLVVNADPTAAVADYRAFLTAHPEVDLIAVMDGTADQADEAIADAGLTGKVYTVGLTLDEAQLDAIDAGIQVVIVQPDWYSSAVNGPIACDQLLAGAGVAATGVPPLTYGVRDTARGRTDLAATPAP